MEIMEFDEYSTGDKTRKRRAIEQAEGFERTMRTPTKIIRKINMDATIYFTARIKNFIKNILKKN